MLTGGHWPVQTHSQIRLLFPFLSFIFLSITLSDRQYTATPATQRHAVLTTTPRLAL